MNMLDDLYQDVLLEHKRHPRNWGHLGCAHRSAAGYNPLCGDSISLELAESGDVVTDIAFDGQGCAICIASTSLMTEAVKGKSLAEVKQLSTAMHELLTCEGPPDDAPPSELGKLAALQGVRRFPSRIKCALLGWYALDDCLKNQAPAGAAAAKERSDGANA